MDRHVLLQTAARTVRCHGMIRPGDRVLAAVSGGADSVAMLGFLTALRQEIPFTLTVAHVNHGLRGAESDADQALVEELCRERDLPLVTLQTDIAALCRQTGQGEEVCARQVRYAFFEEKAAGGRIATAHTADDNAETLLLHLIRGAGLSGLCGIPPVRGNIIRPLLDCTRAMTEDYCACAGLTYAVDRTNADLRYRRNFVRHQLIPLCKQVNPAFLQAAARTAALNRRDREELDRLGERLLAQSRRAQGYDLAALAAAEDGILSYALRRLLQAPCGERIGQTHVDGVLALVRKGAGSVSLPGGLQAGVNHGLLTLTPPPPPPEQEDFCLPMTPDTPVTVNGRRVCLQTVTQEQKIYNSLTYTPLDRDTIGQRLVLRNRRPGDRITLPRRGCSKSLKKLFNELKLSAAQRRDRLIVSDEQGVLWVEGVGCDARCVPTPQTRARVLLTIEQETTEVDHAAGH